jgi:hypothetical protein
VPSIGEFVTSDTITDEQIRELRNELLKESFNQMTDDSDACGMALRDLKMYPQHLQYTASIIKDISRTRCAKILNTRKRQTQIYLSDLAASDGWCDWICVHNPDCECRKCWEYDSDRCREPAVATWLDSKSPRLCQKHADIAKQYGEGIVLDSSKEPTCQ